MELFGDFLTQFGVAFMGFGLVFVWVFALHADLTGWYVFSGRLETAAGRARPCEATSFNEGGSKSRRGTPVYANPYDFTDAGGAARSGRSYAVGRCLREGDPVLVEWPAGHPEVSRARGMRSKPMPPAVGFVLIFPLIGAAFLLGGLRAGLRALVLLREGKGAAAKIAARRETNVRMNNRMVWELELAYRDETGTPRSGRVKTPEPERLDGESIPILYHPRDPAMIAPLPLLPGAVETDPLGGLKPAPLGSALRFLILPALTFGGHAAWLLHALAKP